jgi:hypothetical protein
VRYETIKNCGELGIEILKDDADGMRVTKDFLEKLIYNIVKRSTKYFYETKDHVFIYREKQLNSAVCPSIADLTDSFLMEHPLNRKPHGEDEYSGRVDYWIYYRNYSYVLELKHSYFAYKMADSPRQDISDKFDSAIRQLNSIKIDECKDLSYNSKGLIKIALQAIVFYQSSQEDISLDNLKNQNLKEDFEDLISNTDLNNKSNFRSLWLLNKKLIESVEYRNGYEIYPAVAFVGNASDVIPPK